MFYCIKNLFHIIHLWMIRKNYLSHFMNEDIEKRGKIFKEIAKKKKMTEA